jgi:SAM-dependent methyltransferase
LTNRYPYAEQTNQERWDELAPVHLASYREVEILRQGGIALDEIELREIGEVRGKTLLHLQCHIGTDTLSWARQGAIVTGVDFSGQSIACARQLQQELQLEATFLQCNVYDVRAVLHQPFDIVYTSRGVLCWLSDLQEWGRIVADMLKPGGTFYLMESHPILNIFDDAQPGPLSIIYRYFHVPQPTLWDEANPDYADDEYICDGPSYEWDWSVSDIVNAVIKAGLQLEFINEYERLFWKRFPGMVEERERWYWFPEYEGKLPLLFTLRATKPREEV